MLKKPLIGILGGIGSGKSTVARLFGAHGCAVIDADALAHEVLNEPEILAAVCEYFGPEVLDEAGRVDRRYLAGRVFDNPDEIAYLNSLIHPQVLWKCQVLLNQYRSDDRVAAVVLDMPLLLEAGWGKKCDFFIFVECDELKRLERSLKNGKLDHKQLKKRENFQISLDKKRQIAHYRLNNNSDESDIVEQVAQIFSSITKSS